MRIKIFFMNSQPKISLIFVNYRSARYLEEALKSLFSFEKETDLFEVIVVNNDNAEREVLLELNKSFRFLLIQNNDNVGFGAGNNKGAKQAKGSILGFINPDIFWTGASLLAIEKFFDEKKETGILGMTMLDEEGKTEKWSVGEEPSLVTLFRNNLFLIKNLFSKTQKISFFDWVSGGALFIRKDIFSLANGFDEQFFLYFEDVDLCKKVRNLGFSIVRHSDYIITHLGGKSKHSTILQKKQFYISQKKYFKKHRPLWENKILQFLHFFFCNSRP